MIKATPLVNKAKDHRTTSCQVLSVIAGVDEQWLAYRGERFGDWLREREVSHGWCRVESTPWLVEEIRLRSVRVVLSEASALAPITVRDLAAALPDVKFVHLLHGAPAWCGSNWPEIIYPSIQQSVELPNVYMGVVNDPQMMCWSPGAKVVHLPNPIWIPENLTNTTPKTLDNNEPVCVSLIARPSPVKNWTGMLSAIGILARKRAVRALIVGRPTPHHSQHVEYLQTLGIDCTLCDFQDWEDTLELVSKNVHVGLACGFSDALNLIAAEHCLLGIPVVGSPATDWLPEAWRINPQDPVAMASLVEKHVNNNKAGITARKLVNKLSKVNDTTLLKSISELLV